MMVSVSFCRICSILNNFIMKSKASMANKSEYKLTMIKYYYHYFASLLFRHQQLSNKNENNFQANLLKYNSILNDQFYAF